MANGDAPARRAGRAVAVPASDAPSRIRPRRRPAGLGDQPLDGLVPAQGPGAGSSGAGPVALAEPVAVAQPVTVAEPVTAAEPVTVVEPVTEAAPVPSEPPRYAAPEGAVAAVLDIMSRAQGGDPAAFGELYDHYVDLVYRYIYYRVGSAATAEDLTSETFLRALRRISSFTWQGRDPGAWFVTIARNLVADHYKSGRYRFEVTTADMLDAGADRPQDSPEGEVLDAITHATLLEAVKRLNPEQQECIVLRFLQGFSVAETARAMGKNEGAIKALQYRAVRTLGRLLPAGLSAPERA